MTPDLTATIVDLAGARPPHPADGSSLRWNIRNGDRGWTAPVITEAIADRASAGGTPAAAARGFTDARTTIGLRTARYKLVRWASGVVELYDLRRDPNELTNLVRDPRYSDVRDRLTRLWWHYADCVAADCSRPLPSAFQRDADATAQLTERQRDGIDAYYGALPGQRQGLRR